MTSTPGVSLWLPHSYTQHQQSYICESLLHCPLKSDMFKIKEMYSKSNNKSYPTTFASSRSCINNLEEWEKDIPIAQNRGLAIILDSFLPKAVLIQSVPWSYRCPLFLFLHLYCHCLGSGFYPILPNWLPYIQSLSPTVHLVSSGRSENNSKHLLDSY